MQMGLLDPPISQPPHPQRKGRLRDGSFDPCPTFVELFEQSRSAVVPAPLAAPSVGLWGVRSARAVRLRSACIGAARHIRRSPFCETPPEWWVCLVRSGVGFQYRLCLPFRTRHHLLVPINDTLACIKSMLVMGLPAWPLPHGPHQRHLRVLLTAHQAITRHIRPINSMDYGEQGLVCQPVMNRLHHGHILFVREGRFHMRHMLGASSPSHVSVRCT